MVNSNSTVSPVYFQKYQARQIQTDTRTYSGPALSKNARVLVTYPFSRLRTPWCNPISVWWLEEDITCKSERPTPAGRCCHSDATVREVLADRQGIVVLVGVENQRH